MGVSKQAVAISLLGHRVTLRGPGIPPLQRPSGMALDSGALRNVASSTFAHLQSRRAAVLPGLHTYGLGETFQPGAGLGDFQTDSERKKPRRLLRRGMLCSEASAEGTELSHSSSRRGPPQADRQQCGRDERPSPSFSGWLGPYLAVVTLTGFPRKSFFVLGVT